MQIVLLFGDLHDKMLTMFTRLLSIPNQSFFLLGPRATGKSYWLKRAFPDALWYDLLLEADYLRLLASPDNLVKEVKAFYERNSSGDSFSNKPLWVVIDEIQHLPKLLNNVHWLIANYEDKINFALSGSSARKLKRNDANLLAGRAINRAMFPLVCPEFGYSPEIDNLLKFGSLPKVASLVKKGEESSAIDILESYVATYLKEEIQQEALTRRLDSFARFLKVAAIMNGQIVNFTQIASDAATSRQTVKGYFDVLCDTLLGFFLYAWQSRAKVRESAHPKFYLFDTGVVRALSYRLREPLDSVEKGYLLETFLLNELRAHISYFRIGGELFYWRTANNVEIDFVWQRGERIVVIEVKSSKEWRRNYSRSIKNLADSVKIDAAYGVYLGETAMTDEIVKVLPLPDFLEALHAGKVLY